MHQKCEATLPESSSAKCWPASLQALPEASCSILAVMAAVLNESLQFGKCGPSEGLPYSVLLGCFPDLGPLLPNAFRSACKPKPEKVLFTTVGR